MFSFLLLSSAGVTFANPTISDLRRARQKVPGAEFKGDTFETLNYKLNAHVTRQRGLHVKACEEMSATELGSAIRLLHSSSHPALNAIYQETNDARALRHTAVQDWEAEWVAAAASPHASAARDTKCHDAVMMWIHHIAHADRQQLMRDLVLPLLPASRERHFDESDLSGQADVAVSAYVKASACAFCHGDPGAPTPSEDIPAEAPSWPPASVPTWPTQFTSDWFGWVGKNMSDNSTNLTGNFVYDYPKNRLRENSCTPGETFCLHTYWFGDPQPTAVPAGVTPGRLYRVSVVGGQKSCTFSPTPGQSIIRPDGFAKAGEISPDRLTYVRREFVKESGRWADHWSWNDDPCGTFSEWVDINTHYPLSSDGPTGCGTGGSRTWWTNHKLEEPADETWTDFDFTHCGASLGLTEGAPDGMVDRLQLRSLLI